MPQAPILSGEQQSSDRCEILAKHIIMTGDTVRATAIKFGLSKSTVHKDVTERLEKVNPILSASAREVLEKNKSERHIRGGDATRIMYLCKKCQKIHNNSAKTTDN